MINVGDIMSTMEGVRCRGGTQITKDPPMVQNTPTCIMISLTVLKITPAVLMISLHGTEILYGTAHPPRYCTHVIQGVPIGLFKKVNSFLPFSLMCSLEKRYSKSVENCVFSPIWRNCAICLGVLWKKDMVIPITRMVSIEIV